MRTRRARLPDAARIYALIVPFARQELLLPRSLAEICENVRDFVVVEHRGEVIGCGALHLYGPDLAEVRSIAVAPEAQKRGAGRRLVEALLREAHEQGVGRVCLFTRIPDYFAQLGFVPVEQQSLPEKIWKDCLKCPRFNCCDETAMVFGGADARAEVRRPAFAILRTLPG